MARELVDRFPVVRETLAEAADLAELPLQDLIRDGTDRVNATEVTQPLMFALQVGLARLWAQWGITPDVVMGHSLGDYAAAVARSEEHTSELQSLMRISYAVFCLKKKNNTRIEQETTN